MRGTHHGEVPTVKRCELRFTEHFRRCYDRCVYQAKLKVAILFERVGVASNQSSLRASLDDLDTVQI